MTIGEKIRKARKDKGVTQQHLADLMKINVQTIRSYESNKYKPGNDNLEKLAFILNVPIYYFFDTFKGTLADAENMEFASRGYRFLREMLVDIFRENIEEIENYSQAWPYYRISIKGEPYALPNEKLDDLYALLKNITQNIVEFMAIPEEEYLKQEEHRRREEERLFNSGS